MAFPASPSNNQVHNEGNRSFVYDSALGTWDQVNRPSGEATPWATGYQRDTSNYTTTSENDNRGGAVLQVVNNWKTEPFNHTGNGAHTPEEWIIIPNFHVSITPYFEDSRMLIHLSVVRESNNDAFLNVQRNNDVTGQKALLAASSTGSNRQSTMSGDSHHAGGSGYHAFDHGGHIMDAPHTTNQVTYSVVSCIHSSSVFYINRTRMNNDASWQPEAVSSITVMEIAAGHSTWKQPTK